MEPDGQYLFIEDEDVFEYMEQVIERAKNEQPNWVPEIELINYNGKLETPSCK